MKRHSWRIEILVGAFAIAFQSTELALMALAMTILAEPPMSDS